ncbi:hypothetical protein [Lysinibacillus fusiformis]
MKEFLVLFFTDSEYFAKHFFGAFLTIIISSIGAFLFLALILNMVVSYK